MLLNIERNTIVVVDYANCLPVDVIARSIAMHPTALAEGLREAADAHRIHARNARAHPNTREIAARCAVNCDEAAQWVEEASAEAIVEDVATMVPALHTAGKLQGLSMRLITDIAGRA